MKQICFLLIISVSYCNGQNKTYPSLYIDTQIINHWYCPDAKKIFPPIDLKSWTKTPVINGRLPTFEETENGKSLLYIDKKVNPALKDAKAYNIILPKLAYLMNFETKKNEIVVVIQMIRFSRYTWVGYRYLTGGVGSATFNKCRFLTEKEIKKAVGK